MATLKELMDTLPNPGTVQWIGLRPSRRAPVEAVESVELSAGNGIAGDHYASPGGKRQVTLIQSEHLDVVASILGLDAVDPAALRRNVVVRGINLLALKDKQFSLGDALLEYTGLCHPCSLMEETLGPGGYNAMRGHGGITARVLEGGRVATGDALVAR